MKTPTLLEIVRSALPTEFDFSGLLAAGASRLWRDMPETALAYALHNCDSIDWQAYLDSDSNLAGLDPVWHFLKYGVFEGRKLQIRGKTSVTRQDAEILVSIIVYNFNNAIYLEHGLATLTGQSLRNIEILVVDDASTDESGSLLKSLADMDHRIRVLSLKRHEGIHNARKQAVAMSTGVYVMFMQSGDHFAVDACARAVLGIGGGYDCAIFGVVCFAATLETGHIQSLPLNVGTIEDICASHHMDCSDYLKQIAMFSPCSAIYDGKTCRVAFAKMVDLPNLFMPDLYEAVVLQDCIKNYISLKEQLATSRAQISGSFQCPAQASLSTLRTALRDIGRLDNFKAFKNIFLNALVNAWLEEADPDRITRNFDNMASQAGINDLLDYCIDNYTEEWEKIAAQFQHYEMRTLKRPAKKIGILYSTLGGGGAEQVIIDLASLLLGRGYEVSIILESPHPHESDLPGGVGVFYIGGPYGQGALSRHLLALRNVIKAHPVDVMLFHACFAEFALWEVMLTRYLGIPAIMFPHGSFFSRLLRPGDKLGHQGMAALLRCGDKVAVLSPYEELYYRCLGVNAQCVPNPVRLPPEDWRPDPDFSRRRNSIIVFGRLGEPNKNTIECVAVLAEILKENPEAQMTFVGSFADKAVQEAFENAVEQLGVKKNVRFTGWLEDATPWIDRSAVLLSCAYHESFALTIAEAQARGLPCVMYAIPIMPSMANPSIIQVPIGDSRQAAREIVALLDDEARWHTLSRLAMTSSRRFSREAYIENVENLLQEFGRLSHVRYPRGEDYRVIMRCLGFYGAHLPPWVRL